MKILKSFKLFNMISESINVKCSNCGYIFDYLSISESGMCYVKCPECESPVTQKNISDDITIRKMEQSDVDECLKLEYHDAGRRF